MFLKRNLFTKPIYFIFLTFFSQVLAAINPPPTITVQDASYRPLKMAIPFIKGDDPEIEAFRNTVYDLLEFTGVFSKVSEKVYDNLIIPPQSAYVSSAQIAKSFSEFKQLGIETLLDLEVVLEINKKIRVRAKAVDLIGSAEILYKEYLIEKREDFVKVAKKVLDEIHVFYMGTKGVFSTQIVFIGKKTKNANKQVYTCDVTGSNLKQLTFGNAIHLSPSWSPDGNNILFTSFIKNNPDLYMLDINSSKASVLSEFSGLNSGGVFSPDGQYLIYTASNAGAASLYVMDPINKKRTPLTTKKALYVDVDFTKDGEQLTYVSSEFGNPHILKAKIEKTDKPIPNNIKLTDIKRLTHVGWYNTMPRWSPNAKEIVYASFDRADNRFDLFIMNEDGTNKRRLTLNSGNNEAPTWSPNGRIIMFHSDRHNNKKIKHLYIMAKDGTEQRIIDTGLYEAELPRWGF